MSAQKVTWSFKLFLKILHIVFLLSFSTPYLSVPFPISLSPTHLLPLSFPSLFLPSLFIPSLFIPSLYLISLYPLSLYPLSLSSLFILSLYPLSLYPLSLYPLSSFLLSRSLPSLARPSSRSLSFLFPSPPFLPHSLPLSPKLLLSLSHGRKVSSLTCTVSIRHQRCGYDKMEECLVSIKI